MPALVFLFGFVVAIAITSGRHKKHETASKLAPHEGGGHDHVGVGAGAGGGTVELDHAMPPETVQQVLTALAQEVDPSRLDALARSLEPHYPLSAFALKARAEALVRAAFPAPPATVALPQGPAQPPHAMSQAPHAPVATPLAPAPAAPQAGSTLSAPGPHSSPQELHAAAVLQAAMRALAEETDPVALDGFAQSIQEPYPMAAALLAERAKALREAAHAPAAPPSPLALAAPAPPPAAPPSPAAPPPPPNGAGPAAAHPAESHT